MKNKAERIFTAGASFFCVAFGLSTCQVPDFMTGFFAGMATFISYALWNDSDDDNE